jgi:uncharacterized protein (DUF3084 family)
MPTFTPGWNAPTFLTIILAVIAASGLSLAAFITSRYSLLSKILESKDTDKKISEERAQKTIDRFDALEGKLHGIEAELQTSRGETLAARQEILAVKQENADLRAENATLKIAMKERDLEFEAMRRENKRLSGECESMRRRIQQLHPESEMIG